MRARLASELVGHSAPVRFGGLLLPPRSCWTVRYRAPLEQVRAALLAGAPQLPVGHSCTPWTAWPTGPGEVRLSCTFNQEGLPQLELTLPLRLSERDTLTTLTLRGVHPSPPKVFLDLQRLLDAQFHTA